MRGVINDLMKSVKALKNPSYKMPTVWVWIVNGPLKKLDKLKAQVREHFPNYHLSTSTYKVAKAERIYNKPTRERTATDVQLIFLFRKGDPQGERFMQSNKPEYKASSVPYYLDSGHFNKAKWMAKTSELRMEFYVDLVRTYCLPGDTTMGILCGSKFMVASLVCFEIPYLDLLINFEMPD